MGSHRKDEESRKEKGAEDATECLTRELAEEKEKNLRLLAEFENYRKHLDREREEHQKQANEKLILEFLDVVDSFERALEELRKKDAESADGVERIHKQLMKILEKNGLEPIPAKGARFDPHLHEAFMQAESEEPDGTILEELQRGYTLNKKPIRYSKVKISKKEEQNDG